MVICPLYWTKSVYLSLESHIFNLNYRLICLTLAISTDKPALHDNFVKIIAAAVSKELHHIGLGWHFGSVYVIFCQMVQTCRKKQTAVWSFKASAT